jgi:hypothetical protein
MTGRPLPHLLPLLQHGTHSANEAVFEKDLKFRAAFCLKVTIEGFYSPLFSWLGSHEGEVAFN